MNKKVLILLSFGLCLVIFALSSRNNSPEKKIIGTWEAQDSISESVLTFKNDKTMTEYIPEGSMFSFGFEGEFNGTYEIEGDKITITYPELGDFVQDPSMTSTFEIKGKNLYMNNGFNTITYKKIK